MDNFTSNDLLFWEKPGCVGNTEQKLFLLSKGIGLQVKNILVSEWRAENLRLFFGEKSVAEWFNPSAPMIKSCEIDIHSLSKQEALELMVIQPLLIRRPLMQLGQFRQSGFDGGPVFDVLEINVPVDRELQSCSMTDKDKISTCEMIL